ncbi:hypothetical protein BaRGS_00007409 [Batillaria attramentaria]|uniref:Uncharacterized protein n=1 Tax=Batillaria attramentaria TaxID=370345 RepID=A0ABD0LP82_9CAEN
MSLLDQPSDVWIRVYQCYDDVLRAKAETQKDVNKRKTLLDLDEWYQQQLPAFISARGEKYITHEELAKVMKWKLSRGKFRPTLQKMVESNSPEAVLSASKKAFKALPKQQSAVEPLLVLRGVGPATASAVLAAGAPDHVPFMADESMIALPGLQPLQYTLSAFRTYADQVQELTKDLQKQDGEFGWTPHRVELTLWTLQVAKMLKMDKVLELLNPKTQGHGSDTAKRKRTHAEERQPSKKKPA